VADFVFQASWAALTLILAVSAVKGGSGGLGAVSDAMFVKFRAESCMRAVAVVVMRIR
jgi:hypothetical protein